VSDNSVAYAAMPLRDDNPSKVDLLGFEDVVEVVESIVTRVDLDPITVGINAPWGGGKTTVLQLLQRHLDARENVFCLLVSPWEYDNKTDPTTALIDEVLAGLEAKLDEAKTFGEKVKEALKESLKKLRRRVNFAKAMKLAATSALTVTVPGAGALIDLFDTDTPREGTDVPPDPTLQGFRKQFAEIMESEHLKSLERVVVLVDDLDRSLPDTVVETLEAIKLFLSVKKMAFVIAADEENVANAIGRRLATTGQPTTSRLYLEKIVQVPVRIPALSKEQTEEYLALLMLADLDNVDDAVVKVKQSRPGRPGQLVQRLGNSLPPQRQAEIHLAEALTPLLHRYTVGNPRRLKRFLNAYWLRMSFASARGVDLQPAALAKLMLVELYMPDIFGQLLGWLAAGILADKVAEIEGGTGDHSAAARDWGELPPNMPVNELAKYLLLAASLRGETIEEAALPPELRDLAVRLASTSDGARAEARNEAIKLESGKQVVIVRYLASSLRQQGTPDAQKALADSISVLAGAPGAAATAAEELQRMRHAMVTAAVPISLLAHSQPKEFRLLIEQWRASPELSDLARNGCVEALGPR
jgi:KAP-like P-loop domain-containing protein